MEMIEKIKNLLQESGLTFVATPTSDDSIYISVKELNGAVDVYPDGEMVVIKKEGEIRYYIELDKDDIAEIPRLLRTNYKLLDEYNMEYKTWREWDSEKIDGIKIHDPDGFRDFPDDKLYTKNEFLKTRLQSTVQGSIEGLKKQGEYYNL